MVRLDDANATAVYGVSVDSRSRPPNQPDNKYEIDLGRTLDRVKSLQLGSIQIPDCRYAFDSKSRLQYSEPITILPNTHLFVQEEVRTLNTLMNTCVVTRRVVQIELPPSLNQIISYTAGGGVDNGIVGAASPTGLDFALTYYQLVNLSVAVVGAHFPQTLMTQPMPAPFPVNAGPVLTPATVQQWNGGYYGPVVNLDTSYQYAAGYLTALTSSALNYSSRHLLTDGLGNLCAWSYIAAEKPTLTELFTMLNAALVDMRSVSDITVAVAGLTTNGTNLVVTTTTPHGLITADQVVLAGTVLPAANTTAFVLSVPTPTQVVVNVLYNGVPGGAGGTLFSPQKLNGAVQFGYDDLSSQVVAVAEPVKQTTPTGHVERVFSLVSGPSPFVGLNDYLGFGSQNMSVKAIATVPPYILRTVQLRPGNYTADELTSVTTLRMNPLLFYQQTPAQRTLNYKLAGGTAASLIIPCGRYTAQQLVDYLNSELSVAPANIMVSVDINSGKFTFTQQFGFSFTLIFDGADNLFTASNFGFDTVNYSGNSTYTSVYNALQGVASSTNGYAVNPYPCNTYLLTADSTQSHFQFDTGDSPQVVVNAGVNETAMCPYTADWQPLYDCSTSADGWSATWFSGDVLLAQVPYNFGSIASFVGCVITTTGDHNLIDGQSVNISCNSLAGTYTITVLNNTQFAIAPCSVSSTLSGTGGYYASNSTPVQSFYTNNAITLVTVAAAAPAYTATVTTSAVIPAVIVGQFVKLFAVPNSNVEGMWEVTAIGVNQFTAVRTASVALTAAAGATSGYFYGYQAPVGALTTVQNNAGLVQIVTAAAHGMQSGENVKITNSGFASANGLWQITVNNATTFTLVGSTFVAGGAATGTYAFITGIVSGASNTSPIVITSSSTISGVQSDQTVSVMQVLGNLAANGSYLTSMVAANQFILVGSAPTAAYTPATGFYLLNEGFTSQSSLVATNVYTVVVKESIDLSSGLPAVLSLQPTVSIFSLLNSGSISQALGEPSSTRRMYLQAALRDVFQLFFSHPDAKAANFGFPPVAYPPSTKTLQQFYANAFPTYSVACQCVPVANTYQSPYCWNLLPPDYILMILCQPCGSKDVHTHTWNKNTKPIFAKLYVTSPYLNISEQMLFSIFAGFQRINKVAVEFQNPDGSLVEFNGRPHSYELLFTLYEDNANATCL